LSALSAAIFFLVIFLSGCQNESRQINSIENLKNARIGCWPECGYEFKAREIFPDAEYVYLDTVSDLVQNLKQNKIDAFVIGKPYVEELQRQGVAVDYLPESAGEVPTAYIFTKNERGKKFCDEMNIFIKNLQDSGELKILQKKWLESDESQRNFTKTNFEGAKEKIKFATDAESAPFVYLRGEEVVGYEVELIDKFCAAYGYDYEVKVEKFETMLADITTGKFEPTYINDAVFVINSNSEQNLNIFDRIKISLIEENRAEMLLKGAGVTLCITIFSIIFGTLLGFFIYLLYREENKIFNKIIDALTEILQGLPTMVLLLFACYIIFGDIKIMPEIVAIIVFAVILSVAVFVMLKSGTKSISRGQMEAALSLGFSKRRAFIKFIFPQVVKNFFRRTKFS